MLIKITIFILFFISFTTTFGYNKIQYGKKDWSILKSDHFDIYYFDNNKELAVRSQFFLERAFSNLSVRLDYYPIKKIPVMIYTTPAKFQRTNITSGSIGEGTGGFTEIFKKRVVVPFDGDYYKFRHVLHHELVHAFFYSYFGKNRNAMSAMRAIGKIPLWFHEGLAEYFSLGWDIEADNTMRNLVIEGTLDKNILSNSGSFLMYKAGENFAVYLSQKYGEDKLVKMIKEIAKTDMKKATKKIYSKSLKELKKEWSQEQKRWYWKDVDNYSLMEIGKQLTEHFEDLTSININPALSPNDSLVAYFSDRYEYISLIIKNIKTGKIVDVVGNEFASYHNSYHPFYSRITWNYLGTELYYSALSGKKDAIFKYSLKDKNIVNKYQFDNIDIIRNPSISPIENKIVFEGVSNNIADIFEYNITTKELKKLTNDIYKESDPVYSPDGRYIAFTVHKGKSWNDIWNYKGVYNLILLDQQTGKFKIIYSSTKEISKPSFDENPNFCYLITAENIISNMIKINITTKKYNFVTNYFNGIFSYSKAKKGVIFNYYNNMGYDISYIKADSLKQVSKSDTLEFRKSPIKTTLFRIDTSWHKKNYGVVDSLVSSFNDKLTEKLGIIKNDTTHRFVDYNPNDKYNDINKYKTVFTLDMISAGMSYDPINGYGVVGYAQLTDMLGDHKLNLSFNAKDYSSLYDIDVSMTYGYLGSRNQLYFGGILDHNKYYSKDTNSIGEEYLQDNLDQNYKLFIFSNYPINTNESYLINLNFYGLNQYDISEESDKYDSTYYNLTPKDNGTYSFVGAGTGYTYDDRLYSIFGPSNGTNYGVFGSIYNSLNTDAFFGDINIFYKKYFRMVRTYTLAWNLTSSMSTAFSGENYKQYYLGGMNMNLLDNSGQTKDFKKGELLNSQMIFPLRGYDYYSITTPNYILNNLEFRFPFIVNLMFYRPLPLFFRYIGGAVFVDYAYVWNSAKEFIPSSDNNISWKDDYNNRAYVGYGVGIRMNLGYYLVKFDWALNQDGFFFKSNKFYFTLSGEF